LLFEDPVTEVHRQHDIGRIGSCAQDIAFDQFQPLSRYTEPRCIVVSPPGQDIAIQIDGNRVVSSPTAHPLARGIGRSTKVLSQHFCTPFADRLVGIIDKINLRLYALHSALIQVVFVGASRGFDPLLRLTSHLFTSRYN